MLISCEHGFANKDERIGCKLKDDLGLCPNQRYCTDKCEWQNTSDTVKCDRRKQFTMSKNNHHNYKPYNTNNGNNNKEKVMEDIIKDAETDITEEIKVEAAEATEVEAAPEVIEEVVEASPKKIKVKAVVIMPVKSANFTIVSVNGLSTSVPGIVGEKGDEVEVEIIQ